MGEREAFAAHDLAYLREEALDNVLQYAGLGLYCWCASMFPTSTWFEPKWRSPALLLAALLIALSIRKRRPTLAATALIAGLTLADLYTFWLQGGQAAPYLLSVVVGLTGLLFNLPYVIAVSVACGLGVFAVGWVRWGYAPYSSQLLPPVLVIAAVGVLSALSVRNLYLALHWAWERAMAAQRNEAELRERRARLVATAKALDEACQRLEHLNYDLAQAREAAEEARLLKQQFTTAVSHELRTPLNVIVAFSDMMCHSPQGYGGVPLPPDYMSDMREIYRSSQHLLRLVDDVLDLSQIESQQLRLHLEPVALADIVAEAADIMRPLMRGRELALELKVPAGLPQVLVDRARVRQVLLNLLNNARRFTSAGRIEVRAVAEVDQVRVTVADTGVGIAPENHEKVFEEFRQLDGSTTRQRDGTGLGLAISKRFVALHGGRIWVESEGIPGKGSEFHFTLPLAGRGWAEPSGLQRVPVALAGPPEAQRTLLAVSEDPGVAHVLEQGLDGYRLVFAEDAAQVRSLADQVHPAAIVLTPRRGGNGKLADAPLHQPTDGLSLPVIACPLVAERSLGESLGAVDYLVKPVSRGSLTGLLDRLGPATQRILIVDDDPRMARILVRMARSTGRQYEVGRAYEGAEALARMRRRPPDLVLVDLAMPGMDGRALLEAMRQDETLRGIPVAVVTAQQMTEAEERQLSGGVFQVASAKGFTNGEALRLLRGSLEALRAPAPLVGPHTSSAERQHGARHAQPTQQNSCGKPLAASG